jgi:hypothetical protein
MFFFREKKKGLKLLDSNTTSTTTAAAAALTAHATALSVRRKVTDWQSWQACGLHMAVSPITEASRTGDLCDIDLAC